MKTEDTTFKNVDHESKSGFNEDSAPYILSTDFPFLVWSRMDWKDKKVLIIADSGDNILTLWPLGVSRIVAVDIARKACHLNELKYTALRKLDFSEFRDLFAPVYENATFDPVSPDTKKRIYLKIRNEITTGARNWLDSVIGTTDFPSPNWMQLMFAHLIPHFASRDAFKAAKKALRLYPVINLPIESALKKIHENFDVIYLSNIPEYIRQSLTIEEKENEICPVLKELYSFCLNRLSHSGVLMLYMFGDADTDPLLCRYEQELAGKLNLAITTTPFSFSSPLVRGSRFTHTLVTLQRKPCAAKP